MEIINYFTNQKFVHKDRKFDGAMAGLLSWQGYLDAHKAGAAKKRTPSRPRGSS